MIFSHNMLRIKLSPRMIRERRERERVSERKRGGGVKEREGGCLGKGDTPLFGTLHLP